MVVFFFSNVIENSFVNFLLLKKLRAVKEGGKQRFESYRGQLRILGLSLALFATSRVRLGPWDRGPTGFACFDVERDASHWPFLSSYCLYLSSQPRTSRKPLESSPFSTTRTTSGSQCCDLTGARRELWPPAALPRFLKMCIQRLCTSCVTALPPRPSVTAGRLHMSCSWAASWILDPQPLLMQVVS